MAERPTGTVTFLFTDVEGSTRLWEEHPAEMRVALERHDELLRSAIEGHGGYVFSTAGDAFAAAFGVAGDALTAAVSAQARLLAQVWETPSPVWVRMGLHTGEAQERGGDYFGPTLNRAARLMAAGSGGRILLSGATAALCGSELADSAGLVDLGEHRLRDLAEREHVFDVSYQGRPDIDQALKTVDTLPGNLPSQRSLLLGRSMELDRLIGDVADHRLVTLTGVGGVGKTRLALALAAETQPGFRDGAWLVELGGLIGDDALVPVICGVMRIDAASVNELVAGLRPRRMMLVLDNCEHLLDAVADVVEAILNGCPQVTVVLTSREPLGFDDERVRRVLPLSIEDADGGRGPAVELFVERARSIDDDFDPSAKVLADVVRVCERLDGLPLAIELAASRVRSMTVAEIGDRLADAFRLLTGSGRRGGVERHQTLRSAVEWSHSLLDETDATVFALLGVFSGGFTAQAAVAVADAIELDDWVVLDALESLVAKSLLVADNTRADKRFRLLETIRLFALEKLTAADRTIAARQAHLAYFVELRDEIERGFLGPAGDVLKESGFAELDNFRSAFEWALENGDIDSAQRIAGSTFLVMVSKAPEVPQDWAPKSVASGHIGSWTADACANAGWGGLEQANIDRAWTYINQGQEALDAGSIDTGAIARLRVAVGAFSGHQYGDAGEIIDRELEAARAAGDQQRLLHAYFYKATSMHTDPARGQIIVDALEQLALADSPILNAYIQTTAAFTAVYLDDPKIDDLLQVAIDASVTVRFDIGELHCRTLRAYRWAQQGRRDDSIRELLDIMRRWRFAADRRAWWTLREIAAVETRFGDPEAGARLLGAISRLDFPVFPSYDDPNQEDTTKQVLAEKLGRTWLDQLLAEGRNLTDDQLFELAETL